MMDAGSDVTFRWTVDDKPSFTFYNNVFNVVYQTPAVYKLSVSQDSALLASFVLSRRRSWASLQRSFSMAGQKKALTQSRMGFLYSRVE